MSANEVPLPPSAMFWLATRLRATLTLQFKGAGIGIFDVVGSDTGDLEFSIDGGEWQLRPNFDPGYLKGFRSSSRLLVRGLDPNRLHELHLRVAAKQPEGSKGRFARIGCLLVDGDIKDPYAGKTPLERLNGIYAAMDPLRYTPPADRWQRHPRARYSGSGREAASRLSCWATAS